MKLTRDLIEAGRTPYGGFTLAQLRFLKIPCDQPNGWPRKGWIDRASGREVTEGDYARFLAIGGMDRKQRNTARKEAKKESKLQGQQPLFEI